MIRQRMKMFGRLYTLPNGVLRVVSVSTNGYGWSWIFEITEDLADLMQVSKGQNNRTWLQVRSTGEPADAIRAITAMIVADVAKAA